MAGENGTNGTSSNANGHGTPPERLHSEHNHIKIVCVGAGAAGLVTAYKAARLLKNYTFTIYDKYGRPSELKKFPIRLTNPVETTRYPGIGCDIPSHSYTFGFEGNSEWDGYYPYGHQVQKYFTDFCEKYGLRKHVQFKTTVRRATWCDETGLWNLDLQHADGTTSTASCNVLVNGSGPLNKWKWPNIKGLHDFGGKLVHTASWDPSIDWAGKKVGVIGNGSSGIQIIPQLAKSAEHVYVFARSPQWIVPPAAWQDIRVIPNSDQSGMPAPAGKHVYTETEKEIFRNDPERFLKYRKAVDGAQHERYAAFLKDHPAHAMVNGMVSQMVEARLGPEPAAWKELYRPTFSIGCKRPTPGDEFLETLHKDHVTSVLTEIAEVTKSGVRTADGKHYDLDLLVCATGFDVGFAPHFEVVGLHGKNMKHEWAEAPQCYLSVASPNFPNLYFIGGPTGNWSQGTIPVSHEVQAEYAMQCAAKISVENLHSLTPRADVTRQWVEHVNKWHREKSVFGEDCKSWMKYNGNIQLWAGSFFSMLKTIQVPRWEDYHIVRKDANIWSFLGDGRTEREILKERGQDVDMSPYMRISDTPWTVDV